MIAARDVRGRQETSDKQDELARAEAEERSQRVKRLLEKFKTDTQEAMRLGAGDIARAEARGAKVTYSISPPSRLPSLPNVTLHYVIISNVKQNIT